MKAIKWTGPKTYGSFGDTGVLEPDQVLTETNVSAAVMETWVNQGMAEWVDELPIVTLHTGPEKTVTKKRKIKKEA